MSDGTGAELLVREEALESEAAQQLGRMLFEFSRLDVHLGLCLVWVDHGANLARLTRDFASSTMKAKLDELTKVVCRKWPLGSRDRDEYQAWLDRVQTVRQQRNDFVHGRWGIEASNNLIVNVVGMPTSDAQKSVKYSIQELSSFNEELKLLQNDLARLRKNAPL